MDGTGAQTLSALEQWHNREFQLDKFQNARFGFEKAEIDFTSFSKYLIGILMNEVL